MTLQQTEFLSLIDSRVFITNCFDLSLTFVFVLFLMISSKTISELSATFFNAVERTCLLNLQPLWIELLLSEVILLVSFLILSSSKFKECKLVSEWNSCLVKLI